jgi:hypothetical protein
MLGAMSVSSAHWIFPEDTSQRRGAGFLNVGG